MAFEKAISISSIEKSIAESIDVDSIGMHLLNFTIIKCYLAA